MNIMKDYSVKPTFFEFSEFITNHNFDLDAKALYEEFDNRGWTTVGGKPMQSWAALVNARNGVMLDRRVHHKYPSFI